MSNAWREGYCDGVCRGESENPYGWDKPISMAHYIDGFWKGSESRKKQGITLVIPKLIT